MEVSDLEPVIAQSFLVEWTLEVNGAAIPAEASLRSLRERLASLPLPKACSSVSTFVTQEFGRLTCTVRVAVDATDLLHAAQQAMDCLRPALSSHVDPVVRLSAVALTVRLL